MKTVFIVNPKAGKGSNIKELIESIKNTSSKLGADTDIYITKAIGDARQFVKKYCLSRLRFISLLPLYMKGTFLKISGIEKYIASEKCRSVKAIPHNGNMRLCVDGEIIEAGETEFEIVHNAFEFVMPQEVLREEKTSIKIEQN